MKTTGRRTTRSICSFIGCLLLLSSAWPVFAQDVYLCVWRNPERTMRRIFKEAKDYKSHTVKIDADNRSAIEKKLGFELLPGQQESFQYYEMTDKEGKSIGSVIACSQKGQYGAVEFVFGLDTTHHINGIYVQRARERDASFKKRPFLDLFLNKGVEDESKLDKVYEGKKTPGVLAVINGLRKELVTFSRLVLGKKAGE